MQCNEDDDDAIEAVVGSDNEGDDAVKAIIDPDNIYEDAISDSASDNNVRLTTNKLRPPDCPEDDDDDDNALEVNIDPDAENNDAIEAIVDQRTTCEDAISYSKCKESNALTRYENWPSDCSNNDTATCEAQGSATFSPWVMVHTM